MILDNMHNFCEHFQDQFQEPPKHDAPNLLAYLLLVVAPKIMKNMLCIELKCTEAEIDARLQLPENQRPECWMTTCFERAFKALARS